MCRAVVLAHEQLCHRLRSGINQRIADLTADASSLVVWVYGELAEHVYRHHVGWLVPVGVGRAEIAPDRTVLVAWTAQRVADDNAGTPSGDEFEVTTGQIQVDQALPELIG